MTAWITEHMAVLPPIPSANDPIAMAVNARACPRLRTPKRRSATTPMATVDYCTVGQAIAFCGVVQPRSGTAPCGPTHIRRDNLDRLSGAARHRRHSGRAARAILTSVTRFFAVLLLSMAPALASDLTHATVVAPAGLSGPERKAVSLLID